jgi:hypothetical protein
MSNSLEQIVQHGMLPQITISPAFALRLPPEQFLPEVGGMKAAAVTGNLDLEFQGLTKDRRNEKPP